MNKKSKVVLLSAVLASELVLAAADNTKADLTAPVFSEAPYKYVKRSITVDDGGFTGYVRMHHIFNDDADSAIGKTTGSTIGMGLGYGKEIMSGLKIGAEFYGVMDSGLTDKDTPLPNIAYGQFMNTIKNGDELDAGYAWGAHIQYTVKGYKIQLARSQYDSPLTDIVQITHVPNMYEYARVDGEILGGKASIGFITKMAYGSRSMADMSLIGEKTGTAGMVLSGLTTSLTADPAIIRGEYNSIEDTLKAGTTDSSGIIQLGYEKKKGMWNFSIWDQYIDDIGNNLYVQGTRKFPLGGGKAVKLSGHVWNQDISNSNYDTNYGGTLVGAQALLKMGKFVYKAAYEAKDEGGLLNAWGANPGYTSSIFSRNQYRSNVNAYKATFVYKPMKGLKLVATYANYGQSDMGSKLYAPKNPNTFYAQDDAIEKDFIVVYKPRPDLMFKLFHANRVSEYNGAANKKRTMHHTRLITNFAF